jgi:hypothetical protein
MLVSNAKASFSNAFCKSELLSLKIGTSSSAPIKRAHPRVDTMGIDDNVDNI